MWPIGLDTTLRPTLHDRLRPEAISCMGRPIVINLLQLDDPSRIRSQIISVVEVDLSSTQDASHDASHQSGIY